jgi:cytochrome c oxidase accessory protein FixG
MYLWIEQKIEGDRNARIKLETAPWDANKIFKRVLKYGIWLLLSVWTGFTFVAYFTPMDQLLQEAATLSFGPWEWAWIAIYSVVLMLFAGQMREQVCKYMCPYARFQSVMFDPDTLIITYDQERGEPRGARKKDADYAAAGLGQCIDCDQCVAVCPMDIDIRHGLQYECIGCAACIDICDQVMDKMSYPRGLIRYSTENAMAKHWSMKEALRHIARPRVIIYTAILTLISLAWIWGLATKPALRVDIIRDRQTLAREVEDGLIENVFLLRVMNVSEQSQKYKVTVSGLDKIELVGDPEFELASASNKDVVYQVRVPPESAGKGSHPIYFDVKALSSDKIAVHEKAIFLMP